MCWRICSASSRPSMHQTDQATGDACEQHLLERPLDADARDLHSPRDAHHAIQRALEGESVWLIVSTLLWAKGDTLQRLDLHVSTSSSMVILAHLGFQRRVSSSQSSRSRFLRL